MAALRPLVPLVVLLAGLLAALPSRAAPDAVAAAPQRIPLRVGNVSITAISWPFWIAESIGSFEQEGLDVDLSILGSAPALTTAVVSGTVDVGRASMDVHIRAVERGAPITWFATEFGTPIYALLVLTVAAAEAAIGLAILVVFYRNRGSIDVEDINLMKG